jgi:molybdopterin converting factor small subunit
MAFWLTRIFDTSPSMWVTVHFHALQREITKADQIELRIEEGSHVNNVLRLIKEMYPDLPLEEETVMATVDNQVTPLDRPLEDEDNISFIPHIGGG